MDTNNRDLRRILCNLTGLTPATVQRWLNGESVRLSSKTRLSDNLEKAKRALTEINAPNQRSQ
jgi:hypothetical protein